MTSNETIRRDFLQALAAANPIGAVIRLSQPLEHFSIRLGVTRVCEISFAFNFRHFCEKSGDCFPKFVNGARLHFA